MRNTEIKIVLKINIFNMESFSEFFLMRIGIYFYNLKFLDFLPKLCKTFFVAYCNLKPLVWFLQPCTKYSFVNKIYFFAMPSSVRLRLSSFIQCYTKPHYLLQLGAQSFDALTAPEIAVKHSEPETHHTSAPPTWYCSLRFWLRNTD
jgi:hypothetical protein